MARERMVTRTIETTVATALCLDTNTAEPVNKTVPLAGTFKDEKAMLRAVKKQIETDDFKVAKIVDVKIEKALYKQTEAQFIANAVKVELQ